MLVMAPMTMFVLVAQATAGAPPTAPSDRVVQVGVFSYGADGIDSAAAYETNLSAEVTTIYVAGCAVGAGNRPAPDRATDAWRVSGKVQTMSVDEAVIQLDWQRIRTNGNPTTSPGGSVQLTLHPGDRVPLDSARPDAVRDSLAPGLPLFDCSARTIGFEARYGSGLGRWVPGGGARGGGGGISTAAGRSGAGSGGGGGTTIRSGAGVGAGTGGGSGSGRAVHMPKIGSAESTDSRKFDVDLWLVRNAPGRQEEAVHQALNGVSGSAQFAFAPVSIETSRGVVTLQVTGLFRVTTDESGAQQLVFTTTRRVRFAPAAGARDTSPSTTGTNTTTRLMPGPDDVLSFEMPPVRVANGGPAVPDQFAVRVRIR